MRVFFMLLATLLAAAPQAASAWGSAAHKAVGVLAVERSGDQARQALEDILGTLEADFVAEACNWADDYKFSAAGFWSEPLHWVNLAPDANAYLPRRDCPDGQCLPQAAIRSAEQLGDVTLSRGERQLAFAFLCHYTADLAQPLHVGYADDKGGSMVTVIYQGQETNLHMFWDVRLVASHVSDWQELLLMLQDRPRHPRPPAWRPTDIYDWTNESFTFTRHSAYPTQAEIDAEFESNAWNVALNQMDMAATRLAAILNAVLGSGKSLE